MYTSHPQRNPVSRPEEPSLTIPGILCSRQPQASSGAPLFSSSFMKRPACVSWIPYKPSSVEVDAYLGSDPTNGLAEISYAQ